MITILAVSADSEVASSGFQLGYQRYDNQDDIMMTDETKLKKYFKRMKKQPAPAARPAARPRTTVQPVSKKAKKG